MVDKRWVHQGVVVAALVVVFCAICIPFFVGQTNHEGNGVYRSLLDVNPNDPNAVHLEIMIANMDTQDYVIRAYSKMIHVPASLYNTTANSLNNPVRIQLDSANGVLTRASLTKDLPLSTRINLAVGSIAWYPFDSYATLLDVQAAIGTGAFTGTKESGIPMSLRVYQPEDFDWQYAVTKTPGQDISTACVFLAHAAISVRRTFNMYVLLVFVGIWIVTFAIGYIGCMAVIWKRRAPDNPVIFIAALFAVPAFRNTCPGNPPYGVLFDVLSTFFAIGVICTFLVLVSVAYMTKPKAATT